MLIKTLLTRCHPLKSFVYGEVGWAGDDVVVELKPRKNARARCGLCRRPGPTYDTTRTPRSFAFVPLWGIAVFLFYCVRRVECRACGVHAEYLPWSSTSRVWLTTSTTSSCSGRYTSTRSDGG